VGGRVLLPPTRAASYIRGTLRRYSVFPYVLRILYTADLMIGAAL
jgi:4-hydroxyphenylacetate 3-monooxygenase